MTTRTVFTAASIAVALAAVPLIADAGVGRWTSGYGQGINEATVENGKGVTFSVSCPDAGLGRSPSVSLEVPNLRGGENDPTVGTLIAIDNRNTSLTMQRKVLDQNQVIFDWEASSSGDRAALGALIRDLRNGRSVTVAMPSQSIRETFTLAGSGAALRGCLG